MQETGKKMKVIFSIMSILIIWLISITGCATAPGIPLYDENALTKGDTVKNTTTEQENWSQQLYAAAICCPYDFDLEQIKSLLDKGANPNWLKKYETILGYYVRAASDSKNPEAEIKGFKAIEMLFEHGAKLQSHDKTILYSPISKGKYNLLKLLLEKGASATSWQQNYQDSYYYCFTPIQLAAENGQEKIMELLVSYGEKKLDKKYAATLRLVEVAKFGTVGVLKEQLKKGASINYRNCDRETALMNALSAFPYSGKSAYLNVMFLLDMGADVNQKGHDELKFGKLAISEVFKLGATHPSITKAMTFPLHQAVYILTSSFNAKGRAKDREVSYAKEILDKLIKRGAYVALEDEDGLTPLHLAAIQNNIYAAQLLLRTGTKVMPKDKSGKTPLDYAESSEMINLLKKYGAREN